MTLARRLTGLARGAGAFSPDDISGLMRWYDFSNSSLLYTDTGLTTNVSSDGDLIKGAKDKTANVKHMTEGTNPPTYKTGIQNGLSVARFDGTNDILAYTVGVAVSQPFTLCVVVKQTMPAGNAYFAGGSGNLAIGMDASGNWEAYMGSIFITGGVDRSGAWHAVSVIGSGASSAIYNDGSSDATGNPGTDGFAVSAPMLGSHTGSGAFAAVDIGEVLLYNSALGSTDRSNVEGYLQDKWGTP